MPYFLRYPSYLQLRSEVPDVLLVSEEPIPQSVTVACDDEGDHISYDFSSDVRLQFRRSQEMEEWGHILDVEVIGSTSSHGN